MTKPKPPRPPIEALTALTRVDRGHVAMVDDDIALAIPQTIIGLDMTVTGARPTDLDAIIPQQVVDTIGHLRRVDDVARWLVGDLVLTLVATIGESETWIAVAPLGHDQAHIERCVAVCAAVPPTVRRADLSWSHHDEVRRLDAPAQAKWLKKAADKGWSVRQLRAAIREADEEARGKLDGTAGPAGWEGTWPPRIPETGLRKALDQVGVDGAVLWLPAGGSVSPAKVLDVSPHGDALHAVIELDPGMAAALDPES